MKKVSLKDIAKKVGVSTALVSYVLNDKEKESRVGVEMAQKIRKAASEMNYQPNQIARSLKKGKTNTIGLVLADIANPFFSQIARVIEDEAKKNKYTVILGSSDEKLEKFDDLINVLINRQVDGILLTPSENSQETIKSLKKNKIPFVLIDRYFPHLKTNYIAINNHKAAYDAVSHLIKTRHKKIGMVAYNTKLHHMKERVRGYLDAMKENGLPIDPKWFGKARHNMLEKDVQSIIDEQVKSENPVDALFFATNTLAIHGLKYIDKLGLKVPEDLGVVCFDQGDAFDFYYCPLTYINQPISELGKCAVNVLLDAISQDSTDVKNVCLDASLIIKKSCGS